MSGGTRVFMVVTVAVQLAASGWLLLVLSSAGALGDVVLIAEADAVVALLLALAALPLTVAQAVALWRGASSRARLEAELATLRAAAPRPWSRVGGVPVDPTAPRWDGPRNP